jgi:hypothetical protein
LGFLLKYRSDILFVKVPFEQIVRDLEEQSANVRFITCDNDEQTIITQNAIRNLHVPGTETPQSGSWTGNGHSGDGVTTPASPSKERRQLALKRGIVATAEVVSNAYDAAKGAHAIVVCTEWDEFKQVISFFRTLGLFYQSY